MQTTSLTRILAGGAAIVAGGIGLFTLVSWGLDQWQIATFGSDYIPMAPMTALLFVTLSLVLGVHLLRPNAAPAPRRFVIIATGLAAFTALAELARDLHGLPLPWDHWGFGVETGFGLIQIGRMAPLTAGVFLLATLALATQSTGLRSLAVARWCGSLAATAGAMIVGIVILGYAAGTPLGYKPQNIPMALMTALAFLALHAGTLLADRGGEFARRWGAPLDPSQLDRRAPRFFTPRLIISVSVVGLALVLGGFFYLQGNQSDIRRAVEQDLIAIAELKAAQISTWKRERLGDARVIAKLPDLASRLESLVKNPATDASDRVKLSAFLETLLHAHGYSRIALLDSTLSPVLAVGRNPASQSPDHTHPRSEILVQGEAAMIDLHRGEDGVVHLEIVAPLRSGDGRSVAGAVVLTLDAEEALFPLVKNWPVSNTSGESLLVRIEDDSVLFLNTLRLDEAPPLSLRRPLSDPTLLSARAHRSKTQGLVRGTDYRGVPAFGIVRQVSGTPWTIIAKIDQAEAYAPLRDEARQVIISLTLIAAVALLFLRGWWQHDQYLRSTRELAQERATRAANQRLALVMQHANDTILLYDDSLRVVEANERALAAYGRPREEMLRLSAHDLCAESTAATIASDFAEARTPDGIRFETIHRRKDGSTFPVEVSSRPVEIEGRRHVLSIIRDITQLKLHEEEIERLNRLYFVISQVNQVLVYAEGRQELFSEICRVLVEVGRFRIAWIGMLDPVTQRLDPVVVAGDEFGYVASLNISADASLPEGRDPNGTAFRERRTIVCNDFFADPSTAPWHERAARSGFRSSLALPLRCEGQTTALLAVYAQEKNFFTKREVELLEETANDVSFALNLFVAEERRQQTAVALQRSEERFRALFQDISAVPIQGYAADGTTLYWNRSSEQLYGYTAAEAIGRNLLDLIIPSELRQAVTDAMLKMAATGQPIPPGELTLRRKDGSSVVVYSSHALVRVPGQPAELFCLDIDMTERKRAEMLVREGKERYDELVRRIPIGIYTARTKPDPNPELLPVFDYVSEKLCELLDRRAADLLRDETLIPTLAHPEDRADLLATNLQAAKNRAPFRGEYRLLVRGEFRWIRLESDPVTLRDGQTIWNGVVMDVTDRKQAEERLQQFTEELSMRNADLTCFNKVAVGRELRMIELKQEINALSAKLGEPPRYLNAMRPPAQDAPSPAPDPKPVSPP